MHSGRDDHFEVLISPKIRLFPAIRQIYGASNNKVGSALHLIQYTAKVITDNTNRYQLRTTQYQDRDHGRAKPLRRAIEHKPHHQNF